MSFMAKPSCSDGKKRSRDEETHPDEGDRNELDGLGRLDEQSAVLTLLSASLQALLLRRVDKLPAAAAHTAVDPARTVSPGPVDARPFSAIGLPTTQALLPTTATVARTSSVAFSDRSSNPHLPAARTSNDVGNPSPAAVLQLQPAPLLVAETRDLCEPNAALPFDLRELAALSLKYLLDQELALNLAAASLASELTATPFQARL
ncbi:hypothetical protein KSP40_PGU012601 [Platanthera guangdongensis]|uniref:Uncharacterized protein n=1 Tax=Platanthera guangdongensis TaxID=2320717 RepID=A0ABR2MDS7_9ASPA